MLGLLLIEFAVNGFGRNLMQFAELSFLNCKQSLQTSTNSNESTVNLIVIICVYKLDEFAKKKFCKNRKNKNGEKAEKK